MFANFIQQHFMDGPEREEILYFTKLLEQERTKEVSTLIVPFKPLNVIKAYSVNNDGINSSSNSTGYL